VTQQWIRKYKGGLPRRTLVKICALLIHCALCSISTVDILSVCILR